MLLEAGSTQNGVSLDKTLTGIVSAMQSSTRETDVVGWYKDRNTVGVMFTGLVVSDKNSVLSTILGRVSAALQQEVSLEKFNEITFSFHFFPDDWDGDSSGRPSDPVLYPDLFSPTRDQRTLLGQAGNGYCGQHSGISHMHASVRDHRPRGQSNLQRADSFPAGSHRAVRPPLHVSEVSLHARQQR